ncbi:MAG: hypothetical protein RIS84_183 [Pseudomonadota bacterium]|jgi:hypothetical protein
MLNLLCSYFFRVENLVVVGWNSVAYSTIPLELSRFMVEYATLFHPTTNISYPELRLIYSESKIFKRRC